jgi:hypothetical protein
VDTRASSLHKLWRKKRLFCRLRYRIIIGAIFLYYVALSLYTAYLHVAFIEHATRDFYLVVPIPAFVTASVLYLTQVYRKQSEYLLSDSISLISPQHRGHIDRMIAEVTDRLSLRVTVLPFVDVSRKDVGPSIAMHGSDVHLILPMGFLVLASKTPDIARALVAHELAHVSQDDCSLGIALATLTKFYLYVAPIAGTLFVLGGAWWHLHSQAEWNAEWTDEFRQLSFVLDAGKRAANRSSEEYAAFEAIFDVEDELIPKRERLDLVYQDSQSGRYLYHPQVYALFNKLKNDRLLNEIPNGPELLILPSSPPRTSPEPDQAVPAYVIIPGLLIELIAAYAVLVVQIGCLAWVRHRSEYAADLAALSVAGLAATRGALELSTSRRHSQLRVRLYHPSSERRIATLEQLFARASAAAR